MSSRTQFKGKCGFCGATVDLLRPLCPQCSKPVHCEERTAAAKRSGSWASTSWTCSKRARYKRDDGKFVCRTHLDISEVSQ